MEKIKKMKSYKPLTSTEGERFMSEHCYQCIHENPNQEANGPRCDIMTNSMIFCLNDKEYPKEWIYEYNEPTCTAWVKWDWGRDGDPTDTDNPNHRPPEDPNQLCLPFIFDELNIKQCKKNQNQPDYCAY
jgi:hypothetical protein